MGGSRRKVKAAGPVPTGSGFAHRSLPNAGSRSRYVCQQSCEEQSTRQQKHVINACPISRGLFIQHTHTTAIMFAARTNQENAVYQQQQATAAKNHGVNGLAPKTPGYKAPKTPFKVALNDENVTFGAGKTGGKGKDGLFGDGKGGKVDPSAFVTPAGMLTYRL